MTAMDKMLTGSNIMDNLNPLRLNLGCELISPGDPRRKTFQHRRAGIRRLPPPPELREDLQRRDRGGGQHRADHQGPHCHAKSKGIGAEVGSIFIETQSHDESEKLIQNLLGKSYNKREIKVVCVPEEAYVAYYLGLFAKDKENK